MNISPLMQPDEFTCGPTCGVMLLSHYGIVEDITRVRSLCNTDWFRVGKFQVSFTHPKHLHEGLNQLGVNTVLTTLTMTDLAALVKDKPVITLHRSGPWLFHYLLVTDYQPGFVTVNDPWNGQSIQMPEATFSTSWSFLGDLDGNPAPLFDLARATLKPLGVEGNLAIYVN